MSIITKQIKLANDTIDYNDIENLILWLKTNPKLTQGELTKTFEKQWSEWLGCKYSVYVNSGSSANLAAIYTSILYKTNSRSIIAPAVSWATTVSPSLQLNLNIVLCDCDPDNLGLNIKHLKELVHTNKPDILILVHVLGIPNDIRSIVDICNNNNILLIEDCCEAVGSSIDNIRVGNFGQMSTFSFYYGHHISTIEGGMVCTNNEDIYDTLCSIRSHGWDRDLSTKKKQKLRTEWDVDEFNALYTFYDPGFNIRSTDLQAFIGLQQLAKLDNIIAKRNENYKRYLDLIDQKIWKPKAPPNSFVSSFNFPIIHKKKNTITKKLTQSNIECRPLICGSIGLQPFWIKKYGVCNLSNADCIHKNGLYVPNNHRITKQEIEKICNIINNSI